VQVKVWFQNRRTKYKRAKADDDHDDSSTQQSPVSDDHPQEPSAATYLEETDLDQRGTTHDDDGDESGGKPETVDGVVDVVDYSGDYVSRVVNFYVHLYSPFR